MRITHPFGKRFCNYLVSLGVGMPEVKGNALEWDNREDVSKVDKREVLRATWRVLDDTLSVAA